jgi:hypothetical protein
MKEMRAWRDKNREKGKRGAEINARLLVCHKLGSFRN